MIHIYTTKFKEPETKKYTAEHMAGLSLLSQALSDLYDIQIPANKLDEHLEKNEHGKPALRDYPKIHFNISHTHNLAVCALSDETIGVDVEAIREFTPAIFRKVFTPEEKDFFETITGYTVPMHKVRMTESSSQTVAPQKGSPQERCAQKMPMQEMSSLEAMTQDPTAQEWFFRFWTLKEARSKHAGIGLSMSLTGFSFTFDTSVEPYAITCSDPRLYFRQVLLEGQYLLSVCSDTPQALHIRRIS